jgi:hypothetical protein
MAAPNRYTSPSPAQDFPNLLPDPLVLFFVLGLAARLLRSDLKVPEALYEALALYLLLAIGLKGGVELASHPLGGLGTQVAGVLALGFATPVVAYAVLRGVGRLPGPDSASIAGHYGSVSVVTFAVAAGWLAARGIEHEPYVALFVAILEVPGILVGIALARLQAPGRVAWGRLAHEVFLGKGIVLLVGGLAVGWAAGPAQFAPLKPLFVDLFKGVLALFLLEMGLVVGSQLGELRRSGPFLAAFAIAMPVAFGAAGAWTGAALGFSAGGAALVATLAASASYIAAPTAMRIAIPEANPALSLTAALGVTFPFNIVAGIPLYHRFAAAAAG